jgi:hypothetical protein
VLPRNYVPFFKVGDKVDIIDVSEGPGKIKTIAKVTIGELGELL